MNDTKAPKIEKDKSQFFMHVGVQINEAKNLDTPNESGVRVYRYSPTAVNLQLRAHCGIGEFGGGAKRDMNATVSLELPELLAIRQELDAAIKNLKGGR